MQNAIILLSLSVCGVLGNINHRRSDIPSSLSVFAEVKLRLDPGAYSANVTFSEDASPLRLPIFNVPSCTNDEVWVKIKTFSNVAGASKGAVSVSSQNGNKGFNNVLDFSSSEHGKRERPTYSPQEELSILAYCATGSTPGSLQPPLSKPRLWPSFPGLFEAMQRTNRLVASQTSDTSQTLHASFTDLSPQTNNKDSSTGLKPLSSTPSGKVESPNGQHTSLSMSPIVPKPNPSKSLPEDYMQTPNSTSPPTKSASATEVTLAASSQTSEPGAERRYMCLCTAI